MKYVAVTSSAAMIEKQLDEFIRHVKPIPGIKKNEDRQLFVSCMARSFSWHAGWVQSASTGSIASMEVFDPLKLAIRQKQEGHKMDAWWLTFLATWFGKHATTGWRLTAAIYTGLHSSKHWNWEAVSAAPELFEDWMSANQPLLMHSGRLGGLHKQELFDGYEAARATEMLGRFIRWWHIGYAENIGDAVMYAGQSPHALFRYMMRDVSEGLVIAPYHQYHFLTWAGLLGLADIQPDAAYLSNGSVYKKACRWFFYGKSPAKATGKELTQDLALLAAYLDTPFIFAVLEAAICNFYQRRQCEPSCR
ncbi:alpha-glutamyl/putrescinyl thymine pyrophosphorylase clade 3 protein [Chitinophaga arvensicola]|uniref:Alpha-glutamyl/putrescinyl thymine pyrophosphorylase clade 3 domain-containing protein n=1 Tax=Chitinophaga arvensicola TaxID=29529 RepID=A0A1I0SBG6_9BACT|nr:hypothetical protein [Chitinophaga arvensicola]SEW52783.1 hypothetical protein SAMN04488122_5110 [Chitinophaga arvensicola]